ncbi:MAG TPA: S9 family peptidase [Chloroflexota bacterium]|nr:S9 family peptidase [Chloroflexota bacterium]
MWLTEDRLRYPLIQEVAPAPDGRRVAFVVREPLLAEDRSEFVCHVYLAPATGEGGETIQLTCGPHRNTHPRWSPDGQQLAFLSTRSGRANLYVMRLAGGEPWPLTAYEKTSIAAIEWAPDGRSIAFRMPEPPDEARERARRAKDDPHLWGVDFEYTHLFTVPFAVAPRTLPAARQLTRGPLQVVDFDWLPHGRGMAFTHRPMPEWDHWWETRLARIDVTGDAAPLDLGLVGDWTARPLVSPDGRWIACHTCTEPRRWALAGRVVLYPAEPDAGTEPRALAATPDGKCEPIGWSADGSAVYVLEQEGVTTQLWLLPVSGEGGHRLTEGQALKSLPAMGAGGAIALVVQDVHQPNAVAMLDTAPAEGDPGPGAPQRRVVRRVAAPSLPAEWPAGPLPPVEVIRWEAEDGRAIEGLLALPVGYQPGRPVPLVVEVHGGPPSAFTRGYVGAPERTVDVMSFTAAGYAILRPNPRGSSGYGRDFRFANEGDWGGGDFRDVMAGVDHLIEREIADPARLGIAGWSYGGYLTASAITQTERFKAACVGAGITNAISFNGTADIPAFIPDYLGAEFWDDLETYRRVSPVLNAPRVRTPTLIVHGEADVRVPVSQGRELYNALKRLGVPVEMVIYPRQGHGFSEPRLMLDVRRRIVAWFGRYLG